MRYCGWLVSLVAAAAFATAVAAAPAPSDLGPEVPVSEGAGGFVGKLSTSPTHGPAGTLVTVTGEGMPPGVPMDLVWTTVQGSWKVVDGSYTGRDFAPKGYRFATVTAGADGAFKANFTTPEDFGFLHDVLVQRESRRLNQAGYSVDLTMTLSPESGPLGTPITVEVHGLGHRYLENSWTLVYDNSFTGWLSSVTTGGTARFTIPATGEEGTHVLRLVHAGFTYPYLNPEQNPYPDRVRPRAEFTLTPGDAVLPPPLEQQRLASVRTLPAPGELVVSPEFTAVGEPLSIKAAALEPGQSYQLQWGTVVGNRVAQNGWSSEYHVVAEATASADGTALFSIDTPDDLGGAHDLVLDQAGVRKVGSAWITPTALPLDVDSGPAGTTFKVTIKGGGWSETANIYHLNYDNAYVGYACAFNSKGDISIFLPASGTPGWHYIDVYPGIYKGSETQPNNYRVPQLTYAADHPGEDLPAFHFAFRVRENGE